jgi:uncharacterized spore protein YtfJ
MENLNLSDNVNTLFQSLENFTQNEGVIGKPVSQNQRTFLPVVTVTVGYGGGNASMNAKNAATMASSNTNSNTGTGALGLGARLNTEAIIVINDQSQDVSILPMNSAGVGPIMDKIPQILTGMNGMNQNKSNSNSNASNSNSNANNANSSNNTNSSSSYNSGSNSSYTK